MNHETQELECHWILAVNQWGIDSFSDPPYSFFWVYLNVETCEGFLC